MAGFSYGYDASISITTGNGSRKKARRGGPVLFGSIASAQEVTPSPSPGPSMPMPVIVNGVTGGGGGVGGLAIDELGVRRITTRHGGDQAGLLNCAGMGKWEFGTAGVTTLDDQPPQDRNQKEAGVDNANLKLEDPLKTNTNGFAYSSESKPASGSVSPVVGLGGGLDAFSVKDFGFGFGSRRANVSVGGANEDEGREGERGGWLYKLLLPAQAIENKHPESTQLVSVSINQWQERPSQCSYSQSTQQPLQDPSLQVPFPMAMKKRGLLPNEVMSVVLRVLHNGYRHLSLVGGPLRVWSLSVGV